MQKKKPHKSEVFISPKRFNASMGICDDFGNGTKQPCQNDSRGVAPCQQHSSITIVNGLTFIAQKILTWFAQVSLTLKLLHHFSKWMCTPTQNDSLDKTCLVGHMSSIVLNQIAHAISPFLSVIDITLFTYFYYFVNIFLEK